MIHLHENNYLLVFPMLVVVYLQMLIVIDSFLKQILVCLHLDLFLPTFKIIYNRKSNQTSIIRNNNNNINNLHLQLYFCLYLFEQFSKMIL